MVMNPSETTPAKALSLAHVLEKLAPYANDLLLTGSIAARWHLGQVSGAEMFGGAGDIDLVLRSEAAELPAGIAEGFLVNHYHPGRENGNLLLQLIDDDSAVQVDIFTPRSATIADRSVVAAIGPTEWLLVSAEDLTARLLAIVSIVSDRRSIERKYVAKLEELLTVADETGWHRLWPEYRKPNDLADPSDALASVRRAIAQSPQLLTGTKHEADTKIVCSHCSLYRSDPGAALHKPVRQQGR
jgi:hypothetical protein